MPSHWTNEYFEEKLSTEEINGKTFFINERKQMENLTREQIEIYVDALINGVISKE